MGADRRKQEGALVRLRPRGVVSLELWDFLIGGSTIWDLRGTPEFPEALLDLLLRLRAGEGRTRSRGAVPEVGRDFEAVVVGGGASGGARLRACLADVPFPVLFSEDGPFFAELGGRHLLAERLRLRADAVGMVVDVGQVQIKVTLRDQRFRFTRDLSRLPIASEVRPEDVPSQRERLCSFLGGAVRRVTEESGLVAEGIVLALPCELAGDGAPGGCSYAGMEGNTALVPSALREAGLAGVPGFLLNDAELAAVSARCRIRRGDYPRVATPERALVLTLGFGVGAAMIVGSG